MSVTMILVLILAVVFVSHFINSAFGFGDSMVSMPLLTLFLPIENAASLVAILSITTNLLIIANDYKNVEWKSIGWLLLSSVFMIPIGIFVGMYASPLVIKTILGLAILGFAMYSVFAPSMARLQNERSALIFGGLSGIFGGAYNISGPPVVLYGSLRGWRPEVFRVTLQGYFFVTTMSIVIGHWYMGHYSGTIVSYYLYGLPVMVLAVFVGKWVNRRISDPVKFNKYIYGLMFTLAGVLLLDVLQQL